MTPGKHLSYEAALASAARRNAPVAIKPQVKSAATKREQMKALRAETLARLRGDGGTQV